MEYSAEQKHKLNQYADLLSAWNKKINLIGPSTRHDIEARHIADSAQLLNHLPSSPASILDVGSGGGMPGLVLAILAPQHSYTLVERDQRKAAFLRTAAHQLGLAHVNVRAEDVVNLQEKYHIITCRAWAELKDILELTKPLLASQGCWLLLKGQAFPTELKACETLFHMTVETFPSMISLNSWIAKIALTQE